MYTVEMDQETALRATASGGVHLITSCCQGMDGSMGPVVGHFVQLEAAQVEVWRWSDYHEALMRLPDEEEEERYRQGVKRFDFDAGLAPYDLRSLGVWRSLSRYLDGEAIHKLSPSSGGISIAAEGEASTGGEGISTAERQLAEQLQQKGSLGKDGKNRGDRSAAEGRATNVADQAASAEGGGQPLNVKGPSGEACGQNTEGASNGATGPEQDVMDVVGRCRYTEMPTVIKRRGMSPEQLTALNLDKSKALSDIIDKQMRGRESLLLGEFQFAFISFMMCQSLDGFYQWKRVFQLMMGCEEAPLRSRAALFSRFLSALRAQLQVALGGGGPETPDSVLGASLVEDITEHNFLRHGLLNFLEMVEDAQQEGGVSVSVLRECKKLEELVGREMGWHLGGDEDDEYGPVVVDLGV